MQLSRLYLPEDGRSHARRIKALKAHFEALAEDISDLDPEPESQAPEVIDAANQVLYFADMTGFEKLKIEGGASTSDIKALMRKQFDKFSAICNVDFVETNDLSKTNVHFSLQEVDGENGILAFVSRPRGQAANKIDRTNYVLDIAHTCTMTDLGNIFLHEDGHVLAIDHGPIKSVMAEFYIFGTPEWQLDPWTINQAISIHGVRRQAA